MDAARDAHLIEQLERLAPSDPLRLIAQAMQAEIVGMRAQIAELNKPVWLPLKCAPRQGPVYLRMCACMGCAGHCSRSPERSP
jgi:hypothetical protein